MPFLKKISPRRREVRKNITNAERFAYINLLANRDAVLAILLWLVFVFLTTVILCFYRTGYNRIIPVAIIVVLISTAGAMYIFLYQKRLLKNPVRIISLISLFVILLFSTRLVTINIVKQTNPAWATGSAIVAAIILTIAYNQRFAIGMSMFYCLFACLAAEPAGTNSQYMQNSIDLFLIMISGAFCCCMGLKDIRTRIKLLQVSAIAAVIVFITAVCLGFLQNGISTGQIFSNAGLHATITFIVGLFIQSLLPVIEKTFRIATSMTLLDFSDANQPLLKRLALEAPGTFSHSLLIGSIAEAAAEAIGRNGLLSRVGAYYHDIGKINKAEYFIENEIGTMSRHKELAPTMSHLIIIGHVKDGIEMAKEYGLPVVLRQFVETHHGTTIVEHFYNEAKKLQMRTAKGKTASEPADSEFRYPGPKPKTKEAAIVMLADTIEGAVRSLPEISPTKIDNVVHNMAMKRLQDGQFDDCDLSLRELSMIESSISKTLAAHYHGRIAYPQPPDEPQEKTIDSQPDEESKSE
jgi:cyclic-di-AMP phosphodiesterase PgpH